MDPAHLPDLETRMDDVRAVMDAAGSGRAAMLGTSEGAPMALLFAAACPERTRALVLYGGYADFHRWVLPPEAVERFVAEAERALGHRGDARGLRPRAGLRPALRRLVGAVRAALLLADGGGRRWRG